MARLNSCISNYKDSSELCGYTVTRDDGSRYRSFNADQFNEAQAYCDYLQGLDNQDKLIKLQQDNLKLQQEHLTTQKKTNIDNTMSGFNRNLPPLLPRKIRVPSKEEQEKARKEQEIWERKEQERKTKEQAERQRKQELREKIETSTNSIFLKQQISNMTVDEKKNLATFTTNPSLLRLLATDSDVKVRSYIWSNVYIDIPIDILRALATDGSSLVRISVTSYKKTPVEILKLLANDSNSGVRQCVAGHPNASKDILNTIENAKTPPRVQNSSNSGCFAATVCYGSYDCTQVLTFRNFRDEYLSQIIIGRMFIKTYYALSPAFAEWLRNKHKVSIFIREKFLDKYIIV